MIHKFAQNGHYLAVDTYSGAVHSLDGLSFDLLDYMSENSPNVCPREILTEFWGDYNIDEITEAYGELRSLIQDKLLFAPDEYESFAEMLGPAPLKSMCLNIAHDCNLRCEYCFAAKGDFGRGRELMTEETARAAIDFLIKNSGGRRNLELDFFGGEPLMNWDVVKNTVKYARGIEERHGKNFRFTLTTNGLLLNDENTEFINREMSNIVLSLDGRREINDTLRVTSGGSGSYDVIVPKYQRLIEGRGDKDYYVRGTFTKLNKDFTADVLHLYELGFNNISIEPVVLDEKLPWALTESDLPEIFDEYEKLAREIIRLKRAGEPILFFHFMLDLDQGPCAIKRLRGCSCGNEYAAVTPGGDIYPCHQYVGDEKRRMGNVYSGDFDLAAKRKFSAAHIYNKPQCRDCWAKFYCSGGCNANNTQYMGDLLTPHKLSCELEKKRLECAIMIQAELADMI